MRTSPVDTTEKSVSAALVGLLFITLDFSLRGFDIAPDVVGWVMVALSAGYLRRALVPAADARLGTGTWVGSWVMAVITGLLAIVTLLRALGLSSLAAVVPLGYQFLLFNMAGILTAATLAVLALFIEGYARRYGAHPTTLKVLKAAWITGAVTAAVALPLFLIFAAGGGTLISLATLAVGILLMVGLSRCRNESILG